jgi:hypothetical protein
MAQRVCWGTRVSQGGHVVRYRKAVLVASLIFATAAKSVAAQPEEPLVNRVRTAIDRGVHYLRDVEKGRGHWEDGVLFKGGMSSLAVLALLNSGVKPDDPIIERGLQYLRAIEPEYTYVVGLQTMVFAAAGRAEDKVRIQRNVDWLIKSALQSQGELRGWAYGNMGTGDNSNTQYALLGLHDGHMAGAKIDPAFWKSIRDFYVRTQRDDGGWGYGISFNKNNNYGSELAMTTAGVCGLLIAGMELNDRREVIKADGTADNCGIYEENKPLARGLAWIARRFTVKYNKSLYYNLYGLERTGRLTGLRFLGDHDWYREGCEYIVDAQNKSDGSWNPQGHDNHKNVATSFALLFLSKGRTPILVSKLVHGPGEDWNNDRNDMRNLVGYASKEMFNATPLAWQIFDAKRGIIVNDREERLRLTADLLQSPIAYFNGHRAPVFTDAEEEILKEYVEQGGFILAEACCGRKEFDEGFRALMKRLFPESPLRPLPPEHPIWRAHADIKPGAFGLEGIEMGCKTVVVYSPQDISCLWEANKQDSPEGKLAFRVGGNIIAYATGLEIPKPRLTPVEVVRDDSKGAVIPRGYLKVAQLRHDGDWQPAPRAMRNLMTHLQEKSRLPVSLKTEAIHPGQRDVLDHKFLYMHGRNSFSYSAAGQPPGDPQSLANLRANLRTGGLLFADACCGKKAFDTSFREFIVQLFPDKKLEPIPLDDPLFSKELNGEAITALRCRRERADGTPDSELRDVPPYLEGIKHNGRWVVIYSRYDIGCALEKRQSSDCLGYDHPGALRIGAAVVLYALRR